MLDVDSPPDSSVSVLTGLAAPGEMALGDAYGPAPARRCPGDGDVAAEVHQHARRRAAAQRTPSRTVGGECLGRGAEVEADTGRHADGPRTAIDLDDVPAAHATGAQPADARAPDLGEVAVIARELERASHGGIDQPVGEHRGAKRLLERVEQDRAHTQWPSSCRVDPRQLGVLAEPAAGRVDLRELGLDRGARVVMRAGAEDHHCRGGPERPPARACRGVAHDPPDTCGSGTGAGAGWVSCVAAGGCAGGSSGAG